MKGSTLFSTRVGFERFLKPRGPLQPGLMIKRYDMMRFVILLNVDIVIVLHKIRAKSHYELRVPSAEEPSTVPIVWSVRFQEVKIKPLRWMGNTIWIVHGI